MIIINPSEKTKKRKLINFLPLFIFFYIFSTYLIPTNFTNFLSQFFLYLLVGITFLNLLLKQMPLKLTKYLIWYFSFAILCLISLLYSIDSSYGINYLYLIFVCWILAFVFIQYTQDYSNISLVFSMYAYSPIFLVLYLLVTGNLNGINDRLGQSLFGNANILGMIMMISLICTIWKIVYGSKKYIIFNIIWGLISLYIIALSGGRKYFLLPFIFLSLLLLLKNYKNNKITPIMYAFLLIPCGFASAWAIMNIPILYSNIGIRFEGLINFFSGDILNSDPSTIVRFMMIINGWKWFLQKPLLGFGVNTYQILLSRIFSSSYAHNNYIELMVDLGITGLIVYYSYYIYLITRLIQIRDDLTGIRNFFLAFMLVLLLFEIGAVTYQFISVHILIGLASSYIWLYEKYSSLQRQNGLS